MNVSRKILGFALSVAIFGTQFTTAFATSSTDPASPGGGDGNILDYTVEKVIVPTAIKIALNPNEYSVTTNYVEADAFAANTVYYTEKAGGGYEKAATQPTNTNFGDATYYTRVDSIAQVVSLNYGVANVSTEAKNIQVTMTASYAQESGADRTKDITFVDTAAKATKYIAGTNTEGAQPEELKMYLALAPSTAAPTSTHYYYSVIRAHDGVTEDYYTRSGSTAPYTYTKVTLADNTAFNAKVDTLGDGEYLYIKTKNLRQDATTSQLSDVAMTASTTTGVTKFDASTGGAKAVMAYKLSEATYSLKDNVTLDFDTTQASMENNVYVSAMGGTGAFTITGAMNQIADWSKAKASKVTFTPVYKITDPDGAEEAVGTGAYNAIKVSVAPSANATQNVIDDSANTAVLTVDWGLGAKKASGITSFVNKDAGNDWIAAVTVSGNTITFNKTEDVAYLVANADKRVFVITFNDSNNTEVEVTLGIKQP